MARRHKQDTATFAELDFMGQVRSINSQVAVLKKSISHHLRNADLDGRDVNAIRAKRVEQLERLARQLA